MIFHWNMKVGSGKMITIETNWDAIVNLMDDDIREKVHFERAPCTE